jgi:dihydrofolate reductase
VRNLIFAINLTLDGCCDHTKGLPDEEIHRYFAQLVRAAGVLVYGRKTYELMVPYWPDLAKNPSGAVASEIEFAQAFVSVEKMIVFSQTLQRAEGKNTRIVRTGLLDEIRKLKQESGRPILVGGVALPSQLIEQGLVDEYRVVIHPVIAGEGRRLFDAVRFPEQLLLKLVETKTFKSGAVALRYLKQNDTVGR